MNLVVTPDIRCRLNEHVEIGSSRSYILLMIFKTLQPG
jgi:hypothetical protein